MTSIGRTVAAISLTLVALLICSNATALGRRTYLEVDVEITRKPLSIGALASQILLESTREAPYREQAYAQARLMNAYAALIEVQLQEARRQEALSSARVIADLKKAIKESKAKRASTEKARKFAKCARKFRSWMINSGYSSEIANEAVAHLYRYRSEFSISPAGAVVKYLRTQLGVKKHTKIAAVVARVSK